MSGIFKAAFMRGLKVSDGYSSLLPVARLTLPNLLAQFDWWPTVTDSMASKIVKIVKFWQVAEV